jgi:Golgi phosphoprotein 3 (GPP34)
MRGHHPHTARVGGVLIAEDLLLLLTNDETGRLVANSSEVDVALGGALLVELMQRVDLAGPSEQARKGRLVVRDASATSDPLLDEALTTVGAKQGKRPQDVVTALGKRVRVRLYDRLVDRGLARAESGKILGIFPGHNWPAQAAAHEDSVRAELLTALRNAMARDARTGALVSLLLALKAVHKAVDQAAAGLSAREMNANAKRIAEGDWGSDAVRHAIDSMIAAVAAATSSTVVLGGGS